MGKYFIIGIASFSLIYLGYNYWITERYKVKIGNDYEIDFTIKPDETFLDGQDDYKFKFYKEGKSLVKLKIPNCPSRCWVINQQIDNPNILILHGCYKNKKMGVKFEIDFTMQTAKEISKIPDNSFILDTLTNLYKDKQLPLNYKYEY